MGNVDAQLDLSELIDADEWKPYETFISEVEKRGLCYCMAGGLANSAYSFRRRYTKDVDLFIDQTQLDGFLNILREQGFTDYFDQQPYDRSWIYRAFRDGVVLDLIWSLPNHRLRVDEDWFAKGKRILVHGRELPLVPLVELIRSKIYVLQSDRCDWPDLVNVLYQEIPTLNWAELIDKMHPDERLLASLLILFVWLRPEYIKTIPEHVWHDLGLAVPESETVREDRVNLLDTRHWFGPGYQEKREK